MQAIAEWRLQLGRFPAVRLEDLGLVAVNLFAVPLLPANAEEASGPAPLLGLVQTIAVLGAVAALATRPPGATPFTRSGFRSWLFAGPLLAGVALVGADASEHLGFDASGLFALLWLGAISAAFLFNDRLPVVAESVRRLFVTPLILLATAWFDSFAASIFEGVDLVSMAGMVFGANSAAGEGPLAAFFLVMLLAGSAAFYAGLIVAPRELAAPEPYPLVWLIRYLVFIASVAVGGVAGGWLLF